MIHFPKIRSSFGLFGSAVILAGCQVGPAYRHPMIPAPQAWSAESSEGLGVWPTSDWWRAFGSPQLAKLIDRAETGNLDVAAASERLEEADAQAREAGSALLPAIGANANGGTARQLSITGHERHRIYGAGVFQATYQLDFWGKNRSASQAAQNTAAAAQFAAQVVSLSTASAVATTYIGLLGVQRQQALAQENLQRQRDMLAGLVAKEQAGIIPLLDLAQQREVTDQLAASLPPMAQQAEYLHTALAVLLGVLPEDLHLEPEALDDLSMPAIAGGLPSQLLLRRPDVQGAEAALKAANANIRVARAAFFPSLNLTASGGIESYALTHFTVPPLGIYSLAASMTQPIFEGGLLRGQLDFAKAAYREDLATYRKAALSAFGDVENALTDANQLAAQEAADTDTLRSARTSAQMAQDAFHGGSTTMLDALAGEDALLLAEESQAQARAQHLQALVGLYRALGGGWASHAGSAS